MDENIHLVVGSLHRGGAQRVCVTIANWLVKQNHTVTIVVVDDSNPSLKKDIHEDVSILFLDVPSTKRSFNSFNHYIKNCRPNIILTFNQHVTIVLLILRRTFGYKYTIVARNRNTLSAERKHTDSFWHKYIVDYMTKLVYRYSDTIIAQSKGMANDLIKNYGVDEDTVTVINNPVSESILERQSEVKKTKRKHQILYVGGLSYQKGVERLIYAFELCSEKDTELQLKIVGDGPKREKLTNLCCDLGIENHVEFCGEVDNVADYYLTSRATVLSSRYEGFPNVLIESITLGTPIVAFDCPSGPAEIVQEKKNGYLVKQNNIELFAERIFDIIDGSFNTSKIIDTSKKYQSTNIIPKYESILIKNERSN